MQEMTVEIQAYAREVYNQMQGFYEDGTVSGVPDETNEGVLGDYGDAFYEALGRLGERFGFDGEDEKTGKLCWSRWRNCFWKAELKCLNTV